MTNYKECLRECLIQRTALKRAYAREVQRRNDADAITQDLIMRLAMTCGRGADGRFLKPTLQQPSH